MPQLKISDKFANRYLLNKIIGVGGYSQVWLAEDIKAGNMDVAIKIYAPEKGLDSDGIDTFGKEFTLVFNLNHAHLLRPMHYDVSDSSPYFVMQYCSNGSLYKRLGEIKEPELAMFIQQASSALKYLHNQDPPIIHQDIKPDNFLIDSQGNYLLADFGISSKIRRTLTKSMGAQASTGTLAYMPPEKFSADKQIIKAGDIFSLGVTMYELLTGDLPFGDNGGLTLKAGAEVPNLPENFSTELNRLLIRCMAKEPWERPTADKLEEIATKFIQTGQWSEFGKVIPKSLPESTKEPEQPHGGRKTEFIPQRQLEAPSQIELQTNHSKKKNLVPWIIAMAVVVIGVLGIVVAIIVSKGPTTNDKEIGRVADSVRISDSMAIVRKGVYEKAREARIKTADSLAIVQAEQQRIANNITTGQNNRLKIGDLNAGGVIFFLAENGIHGKVCSFRDLSSNSTWLKAKSICDDLILYGYDDWYLPSSYELYEMYKNLHKNGLGNFAGNYYWSSSENGVYKAWSQYFGTGIQYSTDKDYAGLVRAIRVF